jgi:hypothetical protein
MIADLKPYAEYKESGLSWIGFFASNVGASAVILAIEAKAEGLLVENIGEEKQ